MHLLLPLLVYVLNVAVCTALSSRLDFTFVFVTEACRLIIRFTSESGSDALNIRKYTDMLINILKMP